MIEGIAERSRSILNSAYEISTSALSELKAPHTRVPLTMLGLEATALATAASASNFLDAEEFRYAVFTTSFFLAWLGIPPVACIAIYRNFSCHANKILEEVRAESLRPRGLDYY